METPILALCHIQLHEVKTNGHQKEITGLCGVYIIRTVVHSFKHTIVGLYAKREWIDACLSLPSGKF